jgi:hypothetical protein
VNDAARAVTLETGPAATAAVEAVRQILREVRAGWRLARVLSNGELPPLNLAVAKGVVMSRPRARPVKAAAESEPCPPEPGGRCEVVEEREGV